jgi:hypothetical protein
MFGRNGIEQTVEKIVGKVLDSHVDGLRQELVRRVLEEVKPGKSSEAASGSSAEALLSSVSAIYSASTQRDILRTLLDQVASYCGRAALFVVKGGAATGWQARGIGDAIKDFSLDANSELVAEALKSQRAVSGSSGSMDKDFIAEFGAPARAECLVLPLMLKEKVAALIYADGGTDKQGRLDGRAVELLVLTTGTWLEVASLRKPAGTGAAAESTEGPVARAAAAAAGPSYADPFTSHAPAFSHSPAAAPASPEPAGGSSESSGMSAEEADVHRKAQRFARLLVDEIKLYNQPKLMEGRKNKDLYDRLKEDIDKSRSTYQKRYGATVAGAADYFSQELIRSLAEDDVSLLGSNFPR